MNFFFNGESDFFQYIARDKKYVEKSNVNFEITF